MRHLPLLLALLLTPLSVVAQTEPSAVNVQSSHANQLPTQASSAAPRDHSPCGSIEVNENRMALAAIANAEKETELLRKTVDGYRDQTNLGLVVIGILLTLVGLLLPILVYLTSVLPASRVVAEARRTLDSLGDKFVELTEKQRTKEIDEAIAQLNSDNHILRSNATSFLAINAHYDFTEKQLFDICRSAENADGSGKLSLLSVLSGRSSAAVTRLLRESLSGSQGINYLGCVLRQISVPEGAELRLALKGWLSIPDFSVYLGTALTLAAMSSRSFLQDVLNDNDFLKTIDMNVKASALAACRGVSANYGVTEIVENSILAKSFKGRKLCFLRLADDRMTCVEPKEADNVIVYVDGVQNEHFQRSSRRFSELAEEYDETEHR